MGFRVNVHINGFDEVESSPFTSREIEILELLAQGKSNTAISDDLNIALKTVQNHLNHIIPKVKIPTWADRRVYLSRWYEKESRRLQAG